MAPKEVRLCTIDEVPQFLQRQTIEDDLEGLKKDDLFLVSQYLDLGLTINTRKSEMICRLYEENVSK